MSCNCKTAKRIHNKLTAGEKGKTHLMSKINDWFIGLLNKLIVILLFIIITPIVILCLIFNFIFEGKLIFRIPRWMRRYFIHIDKTEPTFEIIKQS